MHNSATVCLESRIPDGIYPSNVMCMFPSGSVVPGISEAHVLLVLHTGFQETRRRRSNEGVFVWFFAGILARQIELRGC